MKLNPIMFKAGLSDIFLSCAKVALRFPALSNVYPKVFPGIATFVDKHLNRTYPPIKDYEELFGRIKIFVMQHFDCALPSCFSQKKIYVPIQCGRAGKTAIPDVIGDDTGENISAYNKFVNEYTAIYWVWKHYAEIGNPEFVGFDHYRRFLQWSPNLLNKKTIVANKLVLWWDTVKSSYSALHHLEDVEAFASRFKAAFDSVEYGDFDMYWNSRILYRANMFIMSRDAFFDYSEFMAKCFDLIRSMLDSNCLDMTRRDNYQKRAYGFIMERMTSYWIYHVQKNGATKVLASCIDDYEIPNRVNGLR